MAEALRLLLVEDDPDDVALTAHHLKGGEPPIQVATVVTLRQAVQVAQDHDVVLLDLSLPDGRGLSNLDAVQRAAPKTAVIVLTGNEEASFGVEALRRGADDFLQKGTFDARGLRRAIRYALERRKFHLRELDLVALREQYDTLSRAERSQRDLMANVSH